MSMKKMKTMKRHMMLTALALAGAVSLSAQAETVRITGRLVPGSCNLETTPVVQLGNTISSAQLSVADASQAQSAPVDFTVRLSNCPAITTQVTATVSGTADASDPTLFAVSGGTGLAGGVGIRLTDRDHSNAVLSNNGSSTVVVSNAVPTNRTATFNWQARVKRSAFPVTAGQVQTTVVVNISYP